MVTEDLPIIIEDLPELPELERLGRNAHGQPALERLVVDDNDEPALDEGGKPFFSAQTNGLQFQNQLSLWQTLKRSGIEIPRGPWLDAGCGRGMFFALAHFLLWEGYRTGPHLIGVDMGRENTRDAREVAQRVIRAHSRQTSSPERPEGYNVAIDVLKPQKLQEYAHSIMVPTSDSKSLVAAPLPPLAVVWSNQVFHWIKGEEAKYAAFERLNAVMKPGGVLCMNMSTIGTAKHFLQAYGEIIRGLGPFRPYRREGYKRALFEADPIGSQDFDKMATILEDAGFEINDRVSSSRRETVVYQHPSQYAEAARRYGFETFMRPVAHLDDEAKEGIWTRIVQRFLEVLQNDGAWEPGKPYRYKQYNLYFVAKKGVAQRSPERVVFETLFGKSIGVEVASYLNLTYLNRGLANILNKKGRSIGLQLEGEASEIVGVKTTAPLEGILRDVVNTATNEWDEDDTHPSIVVTYKVQGDDLLLQMRVRTAFDRTPEEVLGKRTLLAAQNFEVRADHRNLGQKERIYEFKIPLMS